MKYFPFALLALISVSVPAFAHEGHDVVPGVVQAPHGGTVKGTKEYFVEIVNDSSGVKIYPLTHDLKPVPTDQVVVTATAQMPKKAKEPVTLTVVKDHFEAKVNAQGAYRYSLELEIAPAANKPKKEKIVFQIEPQS